MSSDGPLGRGRENPASPEHAAEGPAESADDSAGTSAARSGLGLLGMLAGGFYLWYGRNLTFGTWARPGPGLFPTLVGFSLIGACVLATLDGLRHARRYSGGVTVALRSVASRTRRHAISRPLGSGTSAGVIFCGLMTAYVVMFERIKFVPLSVGFLLSVSLFLAAERRLRTTTVAVAVAVGFVLALSGFFEGVLGVSLP